MIDGIPTDVWLVTGALAVAALICITIDLVINHRRKVK